MMNVSIQTLDRLILHTKPNSIERMNLRFFGEGIPLCISYNSYTDEFLQFNSNTGMDSFFDAISRDDDSTSADELKVQLINYLTLNPTIDLNFLLDRTTSTPVSLLNDLRQGRFSHKSDILVYRSLLNQIFIRDNLPPLREFDAYFYSFNKVTNLSLADPDMNQFRDQCGIKIHSFLVDTISPEDSPNEYIFWKLDRLDVNF